MSVKTQTKQLNISAPNTLPCPFPFEGEPLPIVWLQFIFTSSHIMIFIFFLVFYGFLIKYSDILFNYSDSRILTLFCRWVCGSVDLHRKKHCLTLSYGESRIKRNSWWNDSSLCLSAGEWEEWNLHLPCHSTKSHVASFSSMDNIFIQKALLVWMLKSEHLYWPKWYI